MNFIFKSAVSAFSLFLPSIASADCYNNGASGRLANFCALNELLNTKINLRNLRFIDQKLKFEGRLKGLGFPNRLKKSYISKSIYPIVSYSDNINGGNSPKPLVIGNNTFRGDEALYRKEGIVAGLAVGLNGRYIHTERGYIKYNINSSYTQSPKHGIGISSTNASSCSINHIKNWWYLDACVNTSHIFKDITENKNKNISLIGSKVYSSYKNTYNKTSFGLNHYITETYAQNQVLVEHKTIYSNKLYSTFNFTIGGDVENQLTTQIAIRAQLIKELLNKPLKLSINYSKHDGGMLLGLDYNTRDIGISASYPVWKNLTINLGYKKSKSNINYYDNSTPSFGIQFNPIKF